jgi:hypothetical protein
LQGVITYSTRYENIDDIYHDDDADEYGDDGDDDFNSDSMWIMKSTMVVMMIISIIMEMMIISLIIERI